MIGASLASAARSAPLRLGQPGVEFGFEYPLPAWGWALVVGAAALLALAAYRRLEGPLWARWALATLRVLLLVGLVLLLCGPRLAKPNESEEKDWVLAMVDRSASLNVPDGTSGVGESSAARPTREAQLRTALNASARTWRGLAENRVVRWFGFDGSLFDLAPDPATGVPALGEPGGRRTDIEQALGQALRRAAARPISGIVLLSDGRSVSEPSKQLIRRLGAEKVPVFVLPLGSERAMADVSVARVEGPRSAFVSDLVPVQIELERTPTASAGDGEDAISILELVDDATGSVLDTREIDWLDRPQSPDADPGSADRAQRRAVTLTGKPGLPGAGNWTARVRPKAGGTDMIADNNSGELTIELVDRPLRVALFDGYPRWEYRYLTSLLVRERSIASTIMLLAPGRRYVQEGTVVLDNLPRTPEQWSRFDVLVMGDVVPTVLTPEQMEQIKQRVAVGGAGLIWIAGESSVPSRWRGTPLADLLPMTLSESQGGIGGGESGGFPRFDGPVLMSPTPAAERLGVLRLSETPVNGRYWPEALSDPGAGWSMLYWMQRIDGRDLKPAAETLAWASPASSASPGAPADVLIGRTPALLSMRFGAGRSLYVATDEIWRWRYGRGEPYTERFWLQLIRLLGREALTRSGRAATIETIPSRAEIGQPVRVVVTLLDQSLVESGPSSIPVRIGAESGAEGDPSSITLTLLPENADGGEQSSARAKAGATRTYASAWIADRAGRFRVETPEAALSPGDGKTLGTTLEVWLADDELRRAQSDHALLAELARQTGGKMLTPAELNDLPKLLPNRRIRVTGEPDVRTLWDTPLVLGIIVGLLTLEWAGRRLLRLA